MNPNNNQVQQTTKVSQEELARTQVLNFNDVQEIAQYERKTSKRPAILYAIAGILAITLGIAQPHIMAALDAEPVAASDRVAEKIVLEDEETLTQEKMDMVSCVFTSPQNPDGTSGVATYNLNYNSNGQLQGYTMVLEMEALPGNANGVVAIQNYYNNYKALDAIAIEGYTMATTTTATGGMRAIATVDLTKLNINLLTDGHRNNYFARVPYNLGDSKDIITQQLTAASYICTQN